MVAVWSRVALWSLL